MKQMFRMEFSSRTSLGPFYILNETVCNILFSYFVLCICIYLLLYVYLNPLSNDFVTCIWLFFTICMFCLATSTHFKCEVMFYTVWLNISG